MSRLPKDPFSVPAKKSLGQHFLTSDIVPGWMCEAANLQPGDTVLEIGPGTGVLTAALLARGVTVVAVETDARSLALLNERFADAVTAGTLRLHNADIRDGFPDDSALRPHQFKIVANIPYYLSGYLFRLCLETEQQPSDLVFLVQKEIAERITRSKKQSLLALAVHVFGTPRYVRTVSPGHFSPPPRVQSAILAVTNIGHHYLTPEETKLFFRVIRAGFAHKRKQLGANLRVVWPRDEVLQTLEHVHLDTSVRAEDVSLATWIELTHAFANLPTERGDIAHTYE